MKTTAATLYFLLLTISIIVPSCQDSRRASSLKAQYKDTYVDQFKLTYFRQLLAKCYNNSNNIREIINADHSGFTEPLLTEADYKLIDSLTTIDNQYLIADSANGQHRAEGAKGKRPLGYMMNKLTGKWLDSLAKQRLKFNGDPGSWVN